MRSKKTAFIVEHAIPLHAQPMLTNGSHSALIPPAQVIKRFIMHSKKTAFIVEHDFIMAAYLADRVVVYEGQPSSNATARSPQSLLTGAWTLKARIVTYELRRLQFSSWPPAPLTGWCTRAALLKRHGPLAVVAAHRWVI